MKNKVLIIDDAAFNREMLTEILEKEYEILTAEDGQKGIDCWRFIRVKSALSFSTSSCP